MLMKCPSMNMRTLVSHKGTGKLDDKTGIHIGK